MPEFYAHNNWIVCGCDEAGRGCLAGPVFAAAVILPDQFSHPILNDSKQVKLSDRIYLKAEILQHALAYGVGVVSHEEIDEINILKASILAMHRAIDQLSLRPQHLIIDGNKFSKYRELSHQCIIKGDSKYTQIAAASILAKTFRDEYMDGLAKEFPQYGWQQNKGYPTQEHRRAILKYGATPYHRKSFKLLAEKPLTLFDD